MKYMGSKRAMLSNGLGELLGREVQSYSRFVDLFSGSGAVARFVARRFETPVLAVDLQSYSAVLSSAVLSRTAPIDPRAIEASWLDPITEEVQESALWQETEELLRLEPSKAAVERAREACGSAPAGSIVHSYGGHYFSPSQAKLLEVLRQKLPRQEEARAVAAAALVVAASQAAAAPGHTAQPFGMTEKGLRYLFAAWQVDIAERCRKGLRNLSPLYALAKGDAFVADALSTAERLDSTDIAFVDPPYSDVQYSRFYHVLETVVRGEATEVTGVGRYPPRAERPQSDFSKRSTSGSAMSRLLETLAENGTITIVTFPSGAASNGLSGDAVRDIASSLFRVNSFIANGTFSTLGGNNEVRKSRHDSSELVMVLRPKRHL